LVFDVHDRIQALSGATPVRKLLVETTLATLQRLEAEDSDDPELLHEIASIYLRLGDVQGARTFGGIGDIDGALASTRSALDLWSGLNLASPADPRFAINALKARRQLGNLERAAGRLDAALESYADCELRLAQTRQRWPENTELLREIAALRAHYGRAYFARGRMDEALLQLEQAQALLSGEHKNLAGFGADRLVLAPVHAEVLLALGQAEAAQALLESASAAAALLAEKDPGNAQLRQRRGVILLRISRAAAAQENWSQAEREADAAIALLVPLQELGPYNVLLGTDTLSGLEDRANLDQLRGNFALAAPRYEAALALALRLEAAAPGDAQVRKSLATVLYNTARVNARLGQVQQAVQRFRATLDLYPSATRAQLDDMELVNALISAEIELLDLQQPAGDPGSLHEALLGLDVRTRDHLQRFPQAQWTRRNRGLIAWRLATWLEQRAAQPTALEPRRDDDLRSARELYAEGERLGLEMRELGWLGPLEQEVPELFAADVRRVEQALAGGASGDGK
jgi:tetratricopeptide (TPR) repeat protein